MCKKKITIYSVPEARRLVQSTNKLCATTLGGKKWEKFSSRNESLLYTLQILTFILCILILGKGITELTKKNFSCTPAVMCQLPKKLIEKMISEKFKDN